MQEKHLFEYAVIRVVPRVEREEFLNVGVILYCSSQRFLQTLFQLDNRRLSALSGDTDTEELEKRLNAFKLICIGSEEGGTIGKLPIASRFRWLTAARSTIVQTSPVHPGMCINAGETLARLYAQLVQ
ncbi:MAG: hypothetical protein JWQ40_4666 [Segetibacter sp.]|jgi:hypothetical protein|nr:hypothetical protein [Segetibacter sp.]